EVSNLISKNIFLSQFMISKYALKGMDILNNLNKKNRLPKLNIPILEELLQKEKCLCGEDLSPEIGLEKRNYIEKSIIDSKDSDALQDSASTLYYSVRSQAFDEASSKWLEKYNAATQTLFNLDTSIKDYQ